MATISDLANNAAAVSAGYKRTQTDRGAAANPRYITVYDKPVTGAQNSGGLLSAVGDSNSSQGAADATALAALNAQRKHHYGGAPGRADGNNQSDNARGGVHTVDAT